MIAEARILRLGPGPRRRRGRGSCRYGPGRAGGIGGDTWGQVRQTTPISGFFRLKMKVRWKNKANLPGPDCLGRPRSGREHADRACRNNRKEREVAGAAPLAGEFCPIAPNKPNFQVARWRPTALPKRGYGKTGGLWLVENKANLRGRGGSAERAGGSGPGRAKQTQFSPVLAWKRGLDGKTKPIFARSAK